MALRSSIFSKLFNSVESSGTILSSFNAIRCLSQSLKSCEVNDLYTFPQGIPEPLKNELQNNMIIKEDFINEVEEESLIKEVGPYLKRLRYEYDHWDNAIHGFKETERLTWNEGNSLILERLRKESFPQGMATLPHVHILDLNENGHIKPHIDSTRFCGNIIAGLSLLSDSVMRLIRDSDNIIFDVFLKRRSLYIMRGFVRREFSHQILPNEQSIFKGNPVLKKRRVSVICRSEPTPEEE